MSTESLVEQVRKLLNDGGSLSEAERSDLRALCRLWQQWADEGGPRPYAPIPQSQVQRLLDDWYEAKALLRQFQTWAIRETRKVDQTK